VTSGRVSSGVRAAVGPCVFLNPGRACFFSDRLRAPPCCRLPPQDPHLPLTKIVGFSVRDRAFQKALWRQGIEWGSRSFSFRLSGPFVFLGSLPERVTETNGKFILRYLSW